MKYFRVSGAVDRRLRIWLADASVPVPAPPSHALVLFEVSQTPALHTGSVHSLPSSVQVPGARHAFCVWNADARAIAGAGCVTGLMYLVRVSAVVGASFRVRSQGRSFLAGASAAA